MPAGCGPARWCDRATVTPEPAVRRRALSLAGPPQRQSARRADVAPRRGGRGRPGPGTGEPLAALEPPVEPRRQPAARCPECQFQARRMNCHDGIRVARDGPRTVIMPSQCAPGRGPPGGRARLERVHASARRPGPTRRTSFGSDDGSRSPARVAVSGLCAGDYQRPERHAQLAPGRPA
jgi:hypothetical protein